ncbi:MAG TPA: MFS transporter, partial [Gemmataceae bacterium]|nr:MFS transporter [Gemmataceae bacterium]
MNGSQEPDRAGTFLMNWMWRKPADTLGERARRRIVVHLIPWLFFLYILAFLDRANISVAKFGMEKPPIDGGLGFNNEIIGLGFGMFFWGYWFLEVPSTISVVRWGARWVFVRILILWGICTVFIGSIGTSFATKMFSWLPHFPEHTAAIDGIDQRIEAWFGWVARLGDHPDPLNAVSDFMNFLNGLPESPINQFYFFRFMLGFFEGGFFPSVIVYLGLWFRTEDRAKAIATFMAAIPLSNVIGNPFSGLILKVNWLDIPGWRWIFVIQGIAPVFAGIATLFFLPSRPNKATWLPPEERDWLMGELDREQKEKKGHGHWEWVRHLGIVLLLTGVYFCQNVSSYGLLTFMPSIFKAQFDPNYNGADFWASVLSSLVYMMALLGMLFNGLHSDRTKERIFHV